MSSAPALAAGEDGRNPQDTANALEEALARASALGVERANGDRFEVYVRRLREAAAGTYPGPLPWKDATKRAQYHEAIAQCPVLVRALSIAPDADPETLRAMVQKVLAGPVLPTPAAVDDGARNALFELSTAEMLRSRGMRVTLTAEHGITATLAPLEPFAVECARVGDDWSWTEGIRRLAARLDRRADGRRMLGLPVLGRDRLQGDARGLRGFDRLDQLEPVVRRTIDESVRRARSEMARHGARWLAGSPVGILVLATPVLLRDRGLFGQVTHAMPFPTWNTGDPAAARVGALLLAGPFRSPA